MTQIVVNSADSEPTHLARTLWEHREYIVSNALQEFLHKYAGTGMGLMWNVVHPIMLVIVFSIVFTFIMPVRFGGGHGDVPFILFLCSGLLPWLSFVDGLQRTTTTFVENAGYLRKLAVPEEVFLAKTIIGSAILLSINTLILLVIAILFRYPPHWTWILIPLVAVGMMLLGFGLGAFFGTLNVFARDVSQLVAIITQLWMWCTPIVYSSEAMPKWLLTAQLANPIFPFIELFRNLFLFGNPGPGIYWVGIVFWTSAALWLGSTTLRAYRSELRDVI